MLTGRERRPIRRAVMVPFLAGCLLLASVADPAASAAASGSPPEGPVPVLGSCPGAHGAVLCGSIRVPTYWAIGPASGSLTVRFRVYRHTDRRLPGLEPVVAFEGGPGYPSIGSANAYLFMLGPLMARHDLIVMDQRGTGTSSPIDCPLLQYDEGPYPVQVAACVDRLGRAANAYGTAAVAHDMAAILGGLGVSKVDVYGDSYGTYAAQSFILHYPGLVRAAVLDGAFNNSFNPFEPEASNALRRAWTSVCDLAGTCPGILNSIARFDGGLARHPLEGMARDADGKLWRVDLTPAGMAQLVFDATYAYSFFRDLPAALAASRRGDSIPMLRLAAEDEAMNAPGGSPSDYSVGDYAAVSCHDYPTIWNISSPVRERSRQLTAAIAGLPAKTFYPFVKGVWLRSMDEQELVAGCLAWPQPVIPDPAFPPGIRPPDLPVLVLDGQLDQATPLGDALAVARYFPNSTFVETMNTNHISALDDFQGCATAIVRRFLTTLQAGDTACAIGISPVYVVPRFPVDLSGALQAKPAGPDDHSTPADRRAAWVAAQTIGDAFSRWYNLMYGSTGVGLYGGTYDVAGPFLSHRPLTISFAGTRFVSNMALSGTVTWDRKSLVVSGRVEVSGPNGLGGSLDLSFPTNRRDGRALFRGTMNGRTVDLETAVPWGPHG